VERTSGRRGEDITNADQISLLNSSIEIALKRQSDKSNNEKKYIATEVCTHCKNLIVNVMAVFLMSVQLWTYVVLKTDF
jgi:hypothetical protein